MKRFLIYSVLCMLSVLPACVTMRDCQIETLQPAKFTYSKDQVNHVALCASPELLHNSILTNEIIEVMSTDSLIFNILYSLKQTWQSAPGCENMNFTIIVSDQAPPTDLSFDMIVRLDRILIRNSVYEEQFYSMEWEAFLQSFYIAEWSLRDRDSQLIDIHAHRDMITWYSGLQKTKSEARDSLPSVYNAWWDIGILAAKYYATRVSPHWQKETRPIYLIPKDKELSEKAYSAMQNNGYERAFHIWEEMLIASKKKGQKRRKGYLTYNMAVARECQNLLDEAIQWSETSAKNSSNSINKDYLSRLKKRMLEREILDRQIAQ